MLIRARQTSRLHRRQCVACGYAGRFVDRPSQPTCPRCACDFATRPPRSYAEMEGFEEAGVPIIPRSARIAGDPVAGEWRLVERWVMFLFSVMAVGIAVVAFGFALVAVA